jgi:haloalkane dehalogenase
LAADALNFFARSIMPHGIYHKERLTDALRNAYTGPFPTPASRLPTWVFPRHIRKSRDWLRRLEAQLPSLSSLPVQILWGRRDEPGFRPIEMRRWQRHLPLHETEVLDDASHFVPEDRPDRVIRAIRGVLERASTDAAATGVIRTRSAEQQPQRQQKLSVNGKLNAAGEKTSCG